jgi:hypothetical protein
MASSITSAGESQATRIEIAGLGTPAELLGDRIGFPQDQILDAEALAPPLLLPGRNLDDPGDTQALTPQVLGESEQRALNQGA